MHSHGTINKTDLCFPPFFVYIPHNPCFSLADPFHKKKAFIVNFYDAIMRHSSSSYWPSNLTQNPSSPSCNTQSMALHFKEVDYPEGVKQTPYRRTGTRIYHRHGRF